MMSDSTRLSLKIHQTTTQEDPTGQHKSPQSVSSNVTHTHIKIHIIASSWTYHLFHLRADCRHLFLQCTTLIGCIDMFIHDLWDITIYIFFRDRNFLSTLSQRMVRGSSMATHQQQQQRNTVPDRPKVSLRRPTSGGNVCLVNFRIFLIHRSHIPPP